MFWFYVYLNKFNEITVSFNCIFESLYPKQFSVLTSFPLYVLIFNVLQERKTTKAAALFITSELFILIAFKSSQIKIRLFPLILTTFLYYSITTFEFPITVKFGLGRCVGDPCFQFEWARFLVLLFLPHVCTNQQFYSKKSDQRCRPA